MDGIKLRETRIQRGLSQRELAEAVGSHQTTISKMERLGHEPAGTLVSAVARVLSVEAADLAGDGSAQPQPNGVRRSAHRRIPQVQEALAPADDPRVVELLGRARAQRRAGAPRPTHYRCPYCHHVAHSDVQAVRHAVACDAKFPGYTEWYGRYVDLSGAEPKARPLRDASMTRAPSSRSA